jgi:hypothetical protein
MQRRCTVCAEHTIGSEVIWTHPTELLCDVAHVESRFGPFRIVQVLVQDRCSVCAKHTMGLDILDAPDGRLR